MAVSLANLNNTHELLYGVFDFCSVEQNVRNTQVCQTWRGAATEVAKKQIIRSAQNDLLRKAAGFLQMVPHKLEFYCVAAGDLEAMKGDPKYSIQEVHAKAHTLATPKKYTVCIASFFRVNPLDKNIPPEKKEDLAGKAFVSLHFKATDYPDLDKSYRPCFWSESTVFGPGAVCKFFPVELFHLTVNNDGTISGDKNSGTVCFALRGRLIELSIEEGQEDVRNIRTIAIPEVNRDTAHTIELTPEGAHSGHIWAKDLYVARLDGAHPKA